MRFVVRGVFLLIGLLLVSLVAGVAALQSPPGRRWLSEQIAAGVSGMIDGTVTVGAVEGNLLSELGLRHVTVRQAGRLVAAVPLVRLTYDLRALARLRVDLQEVLVRSPRVRIERAADGSLSVAKLFRRGAPAAARERESHAGAVGAVQIGELRLVGGTLLYRDRRSGQGYRLDGVNVVLRGRVAASGARLRVTHLDAGLRRPALQVRHLGAALVIGGGAVRGRVRAAVDDSRLAGRFVLRGVSLAPAISAELRIAKLGAQELRRFAGRDVGGVVSGRVAVWGQLQAPELKLALRAGRARLRGRGRIDISGEELAYVFSASLARFDPHSIGGPRGRLDLSAEAQGRGVEPSRLSGTYAVRRLDLVLPQVGKLEASAKVALRDGRGPLAGQVVTPGGGATVEGNIDLGEGAGTLRLAADGFDPSFVLGTTYRGKVVGTVTASLRRSPLQALLEADLGESWVGPFHLRAGAIRADLGAGTEATATADGDGLRIGGFSVRHLSLRARGSGWGTESAVVEGSAEVQRLSRGPLLAERVEAAATFYGASKQGKVTLQVGSAGGESKQRLAAEFSLGPPLRVDVTTLDVETAVGRFLAASPFSLTFERRSLTIRDLELEGGGGFLAVRGTVGLVGRQDLSLVARQFPLGVLAPLVPGREVQGRLRVDARLSGSAARPELEALVVASDVVFGVARLRRLGLEGDLHSGSATVRVQAEAVGGGSASGEIRFPVELALRDGRLGVGADSPLEGEIVLTDVRLDGLRTLAPRAISALSGKAEGRVTIEGTWQAPRLGGVIQVGADLLGLRATGVKYRGIAAEVVLKGSEVELRRFEASAGGGFVRATGRFSMAPERKVAARLTASRFRAVARRDLSARLSGALELAGTAQAPQVRGEISVDELVARPAFLGDPGSIARDETIEVRGRDGGQVAGRSETTAAPAAISDAVDLDVRVVMDKEVWLRRGDSNVEMRGELRIRKERGGQPRIVGALEAIRGRVAFQGRGFRVAGGKIEFLGGPRIDPTLDLDLRHARQEYEVILRVSGTASKPRILLESRPPLPEADILALLVFGRPVGELARGQKAALGRQAAMLATSFAAGEVAESVRERLGLDTLEIGAGETGAQLGIGTYVAEDVYVSLQQGLGPAAGRRVEIQYRLTPAWHLEASTDSRGASGVDVLWKYDY